MTTGSFHISGICLLIAGFPLVTVGQMSSSGNSLKSSDKIFATKAAQGGMAEVQMGKLAAEKATDPDVKAFGKRMMDDHNKANDQLKTVDQKIGLTPPAGISAREQATYDKLSQLSGPTFDKAYVKSMVSDHEEDIKEFKKEADSGNNPDLKSFASVTLPVLRGHLDSIRSIESKMTSQGTK